MAPLSSGPLAGAMVRASIRLDPRGLGDGNGNNTNSSPSLSDGEKNTLQILALTFSAISVASSVLTFYWFLKMRRSFRHDLIMLLIQSDMFKALWFMIYPIVVFLHGPVRNTSAFCQVNGFMIALGIEASDFSVLMIAVHSALYISRPRSSGGEGGLYPYRKIAYLLWVVFPVLMASLAFINGRHAYVSDGTYCYLPVRPFWYRLALDWIPRYVIFVFILVIYVSIYYYVRFKFQGFNKLAKHSSERNEESIGSVERPVKKRKHRTTVPSTPKLACHGLIPDSRHDTLTEQAGRKPSVSTVDSFSPEQRPPLRATGAHRFMWQSFSAPDSSSPTPPSEGSIEEDSFIGPSTPRPLPPTIPSPITPRNESVSELPSRASSWRDGFVTRFSPHNTSDETATKRSVVDIFTILRKHPDQSESSNTPISQLRLTNTQGQSLADAEMDRTRDKIRRQLRFLFIYPLVYIGMWILPFVSHGMQYSDKFAIDPPFALTCCTTISICMQAAVDAWLFSTREKPWKHIPGTNGGFWVSFKFWADWNGFRKRRIVQGPGKTREEMVREARAAYRRRDEEIMQRRNQADSHNSAHREPGARRAEWWEGVGTDGAMSPVHEETNPMEREGGILFNEKAFSDGGNTLKGLEAKASKYEDDEMAPEETDGSASTTLGTPGLESPVEREKEQE